MKNLSRPQMITVIPQDLKKTLFLKNVSLPTGLVSAIGGFGGLE